jgi:hypothetical protein
VHDKIIKRREQNPSGVFARPFCTSEAKAALAAAFAWLRAPD